MHVSPLRFTLLLFATLPVRVKLNKVRHKAGRAKVMKQNRQHGVVASIGALAMFLLEDPAFYHINGNNFWFHLSIQ